MEFDINKVKVGDKVIRNDGLVGKVIGFCNVDIGNLYAEKTINVLWENGKRVGITHTDEEYGFLDYYLIGKQVIGNKVDESKLLDEINQHKFAIKQLRKQLWRLRNQMVPDWKERQKANRTIFDTQKQALDRKFSVVLDKLSADDYQTLKQYFAELDEITVSNEDIQ